MWRDLLHLLRMLQFACKCGWNSIYDRLECVLHLECHGVVHFLRACCEFPVWNSFILAMTSDIVLWILATGDGGQDNFLPRQGSASGSCCWHSPLCSWFPALVYCPQKGAGAGGGAGDVVCAFEPECDCELFKLCTNANRKVCKHFSCPAQAPASCILRRIRIRFRCLRPGRLPRVLASRRPGLLAFSHLPLHQQHYPVLSVRAGMLWGDICRLVDKIAEMLLLFQLIKMSSVLGTPWEKWDKGEKVLN